jgi:hypothetical protein
MSENNVLLNEVNEIINIDELEQKTAPSAVWDIGTV